MTDAELNALAEKLKDKTWRMNNLYKIKTKDSRIVLFEMNAAQQAYWANKSQRDIILKARQLGFSTLKLIDYLDDVIWNRNMTAAIIAHKREAVQKLFRIVKRAYDSLPVEVKPSAKYDNVNELYFPQTGSNIYVATEIRGDTCNRLHVSEAAFIENADEVLTATFETVPKDGKISMESTANGVGGYFYNFYQEAQEGKNGYRAFFFPWFIDATYRDVVPFNFELNSEEKDFQTKYNLAPEQMTWRRQKKSVLKDKFEQEYPPTALEAFIASGSPVFSHKDIARQTPQEPLAELFGGKIFIKRDTTHTYALGADVSEGVGLDESSLDVIDANNGEQVFHWSGQIAPDLLAYKIRDVANYFNKALVVVEVNNHGLTTLTKLQELEYRELYQRTVAETQFGVTKHVKKDGWRTTRLTKPMLIDGLATANRDLEVLIHCRKNLAQMTTFVHLDGKSKSGQPNHGMGAIEGEMDDTVISLALAVEGLTQVHITTPYERQMAQAQQNQSFDRHAVIPE